MKISQREARRLKKQVAELMGRMDAQRRTWGRDYPGVHILTMQKTETIDGTDIATLRTARTLGHTLVVTMEGDAIYFYGVK